MQSRSSGFTLIEILVVMGLLAILSTFVVIGLVRPQSSASSSASVGQLANDLRAQQLRSMAGDSSTGLSADTYGVHIESGSYTLFKGSTYSAGAASNYVVDLDEPISLSTTLSSATVVFAKGTGEVIGFSAGANTITITSSVGAPTRIITLNRYGVVTLN